MWTEKYQLLSWILWSDSVLKFLFSFVLRIIILSFPIQNGSYPCEDPFLDSTVMSPSYLYRNPNTPNQAGYQYERWPSYSESTKLYKTLSLNFDNGEFLKENDCHFWNYQMPRQYMFTGKCHIVNVNKWPSIQGAATLQRWAGVLSGFHTKCKERRDHRNGNQIMGSYRIGWIVSTIYVVYSKYGIERHTTGSTYLTTGPRAIDLVDNVPVRKEIRELEWRDGGGVTKGGYLTSNRVSKQTFKYINTTVLSLFNWQAKWTRFGMSGDEKQFVGRKVTSKLGRERMKFTNSQTQTANNKVL